MNAKLGFIALARPTFDVPLATDIAAKIYDQLISADFTLVGSPDLIMSLEDMDRAILTLADDQPDLLILVQASFADSTMILRLAENLNVPLLLWAVPEDRVGGRLRLNSFCGINLAGHGLTRAGYQYEYLYAAPNDDSALKKVHTIAKAAVVKRRLQGTKIGRVGENPAGFDTCLVDKIALKQQLGLDVVQVELNEVFAQVRQAEPAAVAAVAEKLSEKLPNLRELDPVATNGTLGTYVTLRELAQERQLAGIAVRCWAEFFTELGCAACAAMSMLSDEMTPTSCEVDVNGTITQLMLQWISGEPAFGSDLVSFDVDENIAILWHCGLAPLSMADPSVQPMGTLHSNRKMPLLMEFPLKPGRITLARLSEATGSYRLVIGSGEMIQAPPSFTGTTGTVRFDKGAAAVMDTIMCEGLEHHLSLTYGDHVETLEVLARMLRIPVLKI